ncbi:slit homolog 2 protein-like [Haliotis rubra]|uniref:slit homolog 2 protein-like n=1 Tax=Haliotis rubra TaxID=36100 RepID=UPI001EE62BE6|nr:slit homolog 2 protein-like [Haliotis rubra]
MLRTLLVLLTFTVCQGNVQICAVHYDKQYGGLFADCTGRKLQHVPDYLPENITALDMSENDLKILTNNTFYKFRKLIYLNINMNPLSEMEPGAFRGLFSLTKFLLARNKLRSDKVSFPEEVFRDLPAENRRYFGLIDISGGSSTIKEIVFQNTHNLVTVLLASNLIHGLMHIGGLENVSNVDLSGNKFNDVFDFHSFENATHLTLRNCELQFAHKSFSEHSVFSPLKSIQYLDVSMNELTDISLRPISNTIVHLNLSHNEFDTIPIETIEYPRLILIDMSFNLIGQLDKDTRSKLDLSFEKNNLKLIFKGNTFSCSCENLDFILWLVDTPVIYETDRNFPCILDNGTMTGTVDVVQHHERLFRYCTGKLMLSITVYCEADIPFVYRKVRPELELCNQPVRLFLKDRDVLPGVPIADGIICGITNSWKSVLVISDDFLQDCSQWSQFTIDAALYSVTDLIPNRIIVLLVGPVQVEDLPERLLNVVEEKCILRAEDYQDDGDRILWKDIR